MLNLDTHMLIFLSAGQLTHEEERLVAGQNLAISDIVFWELAMLRRLARIEMDFENSKFRLFRSRLTVIPISLEIAQVSGRLDFKSDPADEIIAATSLVERIPLLTRDRKILKSRMVPLAR